MLCCRKYYNGGGPPAAKPFGFVIVMEFIDTITIMNVFTNHSSPCSTTTDDCVTFRLCFITFVDIVSHRIDTTMAPRKRKENNVSEQSQTSERPKRATKSTKNLQDFDTNQNFDEPPTKKKQTNKKKQPEKPKNTVKRAKGILEITNSKNEKLNFVNFTEPLKQKNNLTSDFDSEISSSTLNESKSPQTARKSLQPNRDDTFCISSDGENTTQVTEHGVQIEAPKKKKQPAPKKRKLRPEDQRTLQILSEKFKHDRNGMKCQVANCNSKPMQCSKTSNLKRHLSHVHPKEFAYLFPNEVSSQKRAELETFNTVQDAVELVTVNGYPFAMLSSSGMKGFIKSRLNAIQHEGYTATINRRDIVDDVAEEADLIRKHMTIELKGKMISLCFDVCTIVTLSMLGINVTFMKENDVICWSLGIIPIGERHTAVQLADMIYNILAEYSIPLTNIFSITTDTAKNATATSDVLNLVADSGGNSEGVAEESIFDIDSNDAGLYFGIDMQNEAELQKVLENMDAHTQLVKEMAESVACKNTSIVNINQINCGTHVLQLSVNGALDESDAQFAIQRVHDMCILLRTQVLIIRIFN